MQAPAQGFFVTFEGGEGSGKSTQIRALEARLRAEGVTSIVLSREPGGTPLGQKIRELLLAPSEDPMSPRCEALLMAASRAEHVAKVIRPALARGAIVLCDRYWDASRAYQGAARGLGVLAIDRLNEWGTDGLYPDHVFLFELDPSVGLSRAGARAGLDRLECEGLKFHQKVADAYRGLERLDPGRYTRVDATRKVEEITEDLWQKLKTLLQAPPQPRPTSKSSAT